MSTTTAPILVADCGERPCKGVIAQ